MKPKNTLREHMHANCSCHYIPLKMLCLIAVGGYTKTVLSL